MSDFTLNSLSKNDWQSYLCNVNDKPSSIFFDLALADYAPFVGQPKLGWLWIRLNSPNEEGLSTDAEFAALCKYEDVLEIFISQHKNWHYAGRITTAGRREFYFYLPENEDFELVIDGFLDANPEYEFQTGEKLDVAWDHYFKVLFRKADNKLQ
jgi:Family of unknown function (DUF695)